MKMVTIGEHEKQMTYMQRLFVGNDAELDEDDEARTVIARTRVAIPVQPDSILAGLTTDAAQLQGAPVSGSVHQSASRELAQGFRKG